MVDGTLRLVYAGALTPTYELDVALRAVAAVKTLRPALPVHLDLYGRGDSRPALEALALHLGVGDHVTFHGRIPIEDVPAAIARADVGLAPTRRDPFTDSSLSTKILEYAAMRRPVVASRLPLVERTFPDGSVASYRPGDPDDLATRLLEIVDGPDGRAAAVAAATELIASMAWERDSVPYLALIERLARDR